jgi:hypothetical protein
MERQELIKKIEQLPPDRLVEVERFVELLEHVDSDKRIRDRELADFIAQYAGTDLDLNHDLEAAGVEHLLNQPPYETR